MNNEQRKRIRQIAKTYGVTRHIVLLEVVALVESDMEGKGGKTIDKALSFLEWAYAQPQQEGL